MSNAHPDFSVPATYKGRPLANPFAGAGPKITLRTSADLAALIYQSAIPSPDRGPYAITPAQIHTNRGSEKVYLVSLNGVNKDWAEQYGQATGANTARLAGVNEENPYLDAVRSRMLSFKDIPEGSTVIFAGHSLGGMVAQQLAADPRIKSSFKIRNTITMGSPEVGNNSQEGQVRRLVDGADRVTSASGEGTAKGIYTIKDPRQVNRNSGMKEKWDPLNLLGLGAHSRSYLQPKVWTGVNVLGEEAFGQGPVSITFNKADVEFRTAPAGTNKFLKASYTPGEGDSPGTGRAGTRLVSAEAPPEGPSVAGEKVRAAMAMVLRSDAGLPEASALEGTRPEQLAIVRDVMIGQGATVTPEQAAAVLDLADTLGPEHLTAAGSRSATARVETGPSRLVQTDRPVQETGLSI